MIDCSTRAIVQYGALQQSPGYITLSYVWGESSSEGRRFRNRVPRVVPKVINDAIQVVLSLGYRYLWVDRYCIPESHADKHAQLRKMGDIYQNSDLTIIAAAGEGPHHGLPGASATPRRELRPYEFLSGSQPWALYQLPTNLKRVIRDSNWYKRGWTYQEALLCRRQLVFTKDQVYLQCKKTHCMEILCPTLASDHPGIEALGPTAEISSRFAVGRVFHPMTRQLACTEFPTMVNEYARRKLTYEDDILDAFEGILHRFELLARPLENLYGIPLYPIDQSELTDTDALVYGLLWNHAAADMLMGPDMMKGIVRRGAKREFPSWSWTGWKRVFGGGGLEYHFHLWPLSEILSDTGLSLGKNRFKALVEVHAAGLGGNDDPVMPWETQRENILRLIRGGEGTPRIVSLNLLGWVLTFDVAVSKYSSGRGTEMVKLGPFKVHREELAISCCMAAGSGLLPTTKLRCIVLPLTCSLSP
ncbi:heterokaryon incompatibility protein-domain-containing protein [Echria macrotheca]|uniref:Heterokaryon incompatibility protein-domain-containing protein n=1 Tax=Echria macrotheca TaxID=438768 RepID=A0AAJ0BJA2_9PEZI|nr:heterokaryon incompatibility protein-domain-containing protein [Echria macrotheca]